MQIKIFTIPVIADERETEALNLFLRANKIVDVRRELTQSDGNSCWTFCITYMPDLHSAPIADKADNRSGKIDYKEVLDSDTFERFARLRKLRKEIADKEAVPAYAIFTDAELAEISKLEVLDTANMLKIQGIGKKKVEKYGKLFCVEEITEQCGETNGKTD